MKQITRSRYFFYLSLTFLILSGSACPDKEDTIECASAYTGSTRFTPYLYDSTRIESGYRVFIYGNNNNSSIDDVCTKEPVNVQYYFAVKSGITVDTNTFRMDGILSWIYNNTIKQKAVWNVAADQMLLTASMNKDLSSAYGSRDGWFDMLMEVRFPTHGTLEADRAYIDSLCDSMTLRYTYHTIHTR
jgi:hypothetical protein